MPYFLRSAVNKPSLNSGLSQTSKVKVVPIIIRPGLKVNFRVLLEDAFAQHDETFQESESVDLPPALGSSDHGAPALMYPPPSTKATASLLKDSDAPPLWIKRNLSILMAQNPEPGGTVPRNRSHERRKRKRNLDILENGQNPRPAAKKALIEACTPIPTTLHTENLTVTSCGYQAKHIPRSSEPSQAENEDLNKLLAQGYAYIQWNGRDPRPILDSERRVIGVLAGKPNSVDYDLAANRVYEKFLALGQLPEMQEAAKSNRCGSFPALNFGVTHGKGTTSPVNLHGPKKGKPSEYAPIVESLINDEDLRILATFGSYCFATWAPNVYGYYHANLSDLWEKEPHLRQNFPKSVFPAAAMNAGPNAWTCRHKDSMNCAFGMCSVQSLGKFDHTKGGHLVLPDLELVIEFPANSTILIPSATLIHGNVPILPGEQRASFTQYCAGGLFRYIDCHFMTEKRLEVVNPTEFQRLQTLKPTRWEMGIGLLSVFDDLVEEIEAV